MQIAVGLVTDSYSLLCFHTQQPHFENSLLQPTLMLDQPFLLSFFACGRKINFPIKLSLVLMFLRNKKTLSLVQLSLL
jgi:hypothetical protein